MSLSQNFTKNGGYLTQGDSNLRPFIDWLIDWLEKNWITLKLAGREEKLENSFLFRWQQKVEDNTNTGGEHWESREEDLETRVTELLLEKMVKIFFILCETKRMQNRNLNTHWHILLKQIFLLLNNTNKITTMSFLIGFAFHGLCFNCKSMHT